MLSKCLPCTHGIKANQPSHQHHPLCDPVSPKRFLLLSLPVKCRDCYRPGWESMSKHIVPNFRCDTTSSMCHSCVELPPQYEPLQEVISRGHHLERLPRLSYTHWATVCVWSGTAPSETRFAHTLESVCPLMPDHTEAGSVALMRAAAQAWAETPSPGRPTGAV